MASNIKLMAFLAGFSLILSALYCFYIGYKISNHLPQLTESYEKRVVLENAIRENEMALTKEHFYELINAEQRWSEANLEIYRATRSACILIGFLILGVLSMLAYLVFKVDASNKETL